MGAKVKTILVTGCKSNLVPATKQSGFTMLELLIVLVVMAVLMSIASLSFRSFESDPVEQALERLRFDVSVLSNEAVMRSEPLALGFTDSGYHFFQLDEKNKWVEIENDNLFKARTLKDKTLRPQVVVEQEPISLSSDAPEEPQVIVEPTGELTPFIYELGKGKDEPQRVQFDSLGQVVEPNPDSENDAKS
jgi:general secretion pathway protein H